jgi:hypothetical protein
VILLTASGHTLISRRYEPARSDSRGWWCGCRERYPGSSSGVSVLVEQSAEVIVSADVEACGRVGVRDRWRKRVHRPDVVDAAVTAMLVVVPLVLV